MKNKLILLIFIVCSYSALAQKAGARWSEERIWSWYNKQPWYCGFNYIPAYAINYTAMWDKTTFNPEAIDKELALAESIGLNCLRAVLQYAVYEDDPEYFLATLDKFMSLCAKHKIRFMPALFDDCMFGIQHDPVTGLQPEPLIGWYAWAWSPSPGHSKVIDSTAHPRLEMYVKDVMTRFKDDPRILVWDLYNEPSNGGLGTTTLPLLKKVIKWAREVDPQQPLTVGIWNGNQRLKEIALSGSDIISFHNYLKQGKLAENIQSLKEYKRPIINTEWLNRSQGSLIRTHLPLFYQDKIGCMLWGLVNGKTQTHLPWGHRPGDPEPKVWQHDLYHSNFQPYDQTEIDFLRKMIKQSKEDSYLKQHLYNPSLNK